MLASTALAAAVFAANPSGAESVSSLIFFLGLLVVIWYFLIIRPQGRQRRKVQEMISNLKTGDRVVTTGGILGTIVGFGSNTVQLQIANQIKIEVLRSAISSMQSEQTSSPTKKADEASDRESSLSGKRR